MNYEATPFPCFDHSKLMDLAKSLLAVCLAVNMNMLSGKHILVTRSRTQAAATVALVRRYGAVPVQFPCLEVQCLPGNIRHGLKLLRQEGGHVLFTSSNSVLCVGEILGPDFADSLEAAQVAAVGSNTAAKLREFGINRVMTPRATSQEGLMSAYQQEGLPRRLVFFRAEEGRDMLTTALRKRGVEVHLVHAYRTICPEGDASEIKLALAERRIDAVMLGSAKTARHYVQRIGKAELANRAVLAVISRQVADYAQTLGLNVQLIAKQASFSSILDGLDHFFSNLTGKARN